MQGSSPTNLRRIGEQLQLQEVRSDGNVRFVGSAVGEANIHIFLSKVRAKQRWAGTCSRCTTILRERERGVDIGSKDGPASTEHPFSVAEDREYNS
jgi:hypothetical protein